MKNWIFASKVCAGVLLAIALLGSVESFGGSLKDSMAKDFEKHAKAQCR